MKKHLLPLLLALALCVGALPAHAAERDTSAEEHMAAGLKQLGLFQGVSENDFALRRAPNRTEALVMLIRILGKESEALTGTWRHPFTDVADWANRYVGYAYQNGLTNGVSSTEFGTGPASAAMYLTFVLRALGYSDANGTDFTWDDPYALARQTGVLTDGVDLNSFWRADVARISYSALPAKLKGSNQTLAEKLMDAGVFSRLQYEAVYGRPSAQEQPAPVAGGGQAIYQQCSPAVFCIKTRDVTGNYYSQGSGFFIESSGIAITNHHVLENALSAVAITTDGKEHQIEGVIYFDPTTDYAVIRVAGSGFPYLPIGDSAAVTGGETVYAIGNPKGLTNSISDGIISNPRRADYYDRIQISVPISPGSSGGALINTAGQVIGITTSVLVEGQNLNFAVPIHQVNLDTDLPKYRGDMFSMPDYAAFNEDLIYESLPGPYEQVFDEMEPNGTYSDAPWLDNGDTIEGVVSGEDLDMFSIHCNTVGTVEVTLISNAPALDVKRLILSIEPETSEDVSPVYSEFYVDSDGTVSRHLRYVVTQPWVYDICVFSYVEEGGTYPTVDYAFYYTFTPGDTSGSNSDGLPQLAEVLNTTPSQQYVSTGAAAVNRVQRRQAAYDALKTWVSGNASGIYSETATDGNGGKTTYSVRLEESGSLLVLQYGYELNDVNTFIRITLPPPASDWAASTVSVLKLKDFSNNVAGSANVSIPEFCASYNYQFYYNKGPANEISYYQNMGKNTCLTLLDFADHVLSDCMHTDYTAADLGFVSYKK